MRRVAALSLVCAATLALGACESKGVNTVYEIGLDELSCAFGEPGDWWASAPFPGADGTLDEGCEWIAFPALSLIELEHDLGRIPSQISLYISFTERGVSSTISSGDSGRIVGADEHHLVVENFTEQDFYLRVEIR